MGKTARKVIIIALSCVISIFVSSMLIYHRAALPCDMSSGLKTITQVNTLQYKELSVDEQNNVSVAAQNDAKIYLKMPTETRYIRMNVSDINSKTPVNAVVYLPDKDRNYSENNKIVRKLKDGSNVIYLNDHINGKVRVDLESNIDLIKNISDFSVKINTIVFYDRMPVVPEYLVLVLVLFLFFISLYIIYSKREKIYTVFENHKKEICFLGFFFIIFTVWSFVIPYDRAPDECMRFDVANYIYKYKSLPRGDDPILCSSNIYGISYAYSPYLAYLISAVFMQIAACAGVVGGGLLHAARMVSVLSSVVTLAVLIKISRELRLRNIFLLPCLVGFLPQFTFISAYVNNDAFAIMSVSIVIYAWIIGLKSMWSRRSIVYLTVGLALCVASYYNCYGYLLVSFILYVASYLYKYFKSRDRKWIMDFLKKGIFILLGVCIISGWWFVRNYILYDGDILGSHVSEITAMKYAAFEKLPENRLSVYEQGISFKEMLINMKWITISLKSFVGCFGYMDFYLSGIIYFIFACIIISGLVLNIWYDIREGVNKKGVMFNISLLASTVIVIILSLIYSYCSDFQPQGRYLLPAAIPLMIWVASGLSGSEKRTVNYTNLISVIIMIVNFYCISLITSYYYW